MSVKNLKLRRLADARQVHSFRVRSLCPSLHLFPARGVGGTIGTDGTTVEGISSETLGEETRWKKEEGRNREERERDKRITNFSLLAFPSNIHIAGRNIDLAPSLVYPLVIATRRSRY